MSFQEKRAAFRHPLFSVCTNTLPNRLLAAPRLRWFHLIQISLYIEAYFEVLRQRVIKGSELLIFKYFTFPITPMLPFVVDQPINLAIRTWKSSLPKTLSFSKLSLNSSTTFSGTRPSKNCNGQQKPDTHLGSVIKKFPFEFDRSLIAQCRV